ncbi:ras guanine nucleotide exchange factor domain-containing protein [Zopfochytrium polystomum]|nr:ras guanine nucleotide exchange factor domain-containing protein [Zopfochytrium polystomum]
MSAIMAWHSAVRQRDFAAVEAMLSLPNFPVDVQDEEGNTALHIAVMNAHSYLVQLLLDRGARQDIRNANGNRPLDVALHSEVEALLLERLNAPTPREGHNSFHAPSFEIFLQEDDMPSDAKVLKRFIVESLSSYYSLRDRCKEVVRQLVEEKHIALCKNRILEQSLGITDKETSERFVDQLQYWQDELERQASTIAYLRVRVNISENALKQQEDQYRKHLVELTRHHNEQLQGILQRNEETEKSLLNYQQTRAAEIAEQIRLREELASFRGKSDGSADSKNSSEATVSLWSQVQSLQKQVGELSRTCLQTEEKYKYSENVRAILERENTEMRAEMGKLRRQAQEEVMKQMQENRTRQNLKDESAGHVIYLDSDGRRLKGATPAKLIERLLDPMHVDNQFIQTFLLMFKSFTNASDVFDAIVRSHRELMKEKEADDSGFQHPGLLRIVNVLKIWIEGYWSDFVDEPGLLDGVHALIEATRDTTLAGILRNAITRKQNEASPIPVDRTSAPRPILPKALSKLYLGDGSPSSSPVPGDTGGNRLSLSNMIRPKLGSEDIRLKLTDIDPLELARQLTLIEVDMFSKLKGREFVDVAWMKQDKLVRAPNVLRMSQWSNRVVHWLISEIVSIKDSTRLRAQALERIISMAQHLERLNNFNGVKEVTAALQSSCVYRLRKTKESVGSKYLKIAEDLTSLVSSELNYKKFRARVQSSTLPLIPFPGLYQGDLVFLDTYSKNFIDGGLVNIQKYQKVANVILELQTFQKTPYNLEPVPEIQDYIRQYSVLTDEQAYAASLQFLIALSSPNQGDPHHLFLGTDFFETKLQLSDALLGQLPELAKFGGRQHVIRVLLNCGEEAKNEMSAARWRSDGHMATHQLEQVALAVLAPLVGEKCAASLTTTLFDAPLELPKNPCLSLLVSKVLGLGIVVGGSIVKLPQILKIVGAGSARGISLFSYLLESLAFTVSIGYNLRRENPFSTYGENVFIAIQNYTILFLLFHYGKNSIGLIATAAFFTIFAYALLQPAIVPENFLVTLQWSAIVSGSASKLPQIASNYLARSTGLLSPITLGLQLIGSLARIYTTLTEVNDFSILVSFLLGTFLNGILFLQLVLYWNSAGTAKTGKRDSSVSKDSQSKKKKKR